TRSRRIGTDAAYARHRSRESTRPHPVNRSRRLRPFAEVVKTVTVVGHRSVVVAFQGHEVQEQEPIGIVISGRRSVPTPPRLSAYIHAAAEEPAETPTEVKAA